ncbi:MAG: PKD domain-containing protein [Methanococcaceae archaeon]
MRNKRTLNSVLLISITSFFFSILILSTISAASSQYIPPTLIEKRITTNPFASLNPEIYGNKIVWQDNRSGNWDIFIFDLSTKKQIYTTNKYDQTNPDIYKDKVVWQDSRNGGSDIYLQNLTSKKQTRVTNNGKASNPRIYGDRIVWIDGLNSNSVYLYDLLTSKKTYISACNSGADIYKDRIVWENNGIVYMYNISTSSIFEITFPPGWDDQDDYNNNLGHSNPLIYGDTIVSSFADMEGHYGLQIYDIWYSDPQMIGQIDLFGGNPVIYKDKVVWDEIRDSEYANLYIFDIPTSTETQLTFNQYYQGKADVFENKIVWEDNRNGNWDIYMGTISYSPIAVFSASPVSGKAPLKVQFIDKSTGTVSSWKWSFGDKTYSTQKNPKHTYSKPGKYTVSLTVKNAKGTNTKIISKYITVRSK